MIILKLKKTIIVQADYFIFFMNIGNNCKNIMSLDGTTHCLLYGKRTEKLLMSSTVMETVNELIETVRVNATIWTIFLEGLMLHSSEFFVHFANVFWTCFNFRRVFFRAWIYSTSTEQRIDLRCSRNGLQSIGMGC